MPRCPGSCIAGRNEKLEQKQATRPQATNRDNLRRLAFELGPLLRRIRPACRREIIEKWLTRSQRKALEMHLLEERERREEPLASPTTDNDAEDSLASPTSDGIIEEDVRRGRATSRSGVCQSVSFGRVRGYYARACIQGLGFRARTRPDLAGAFEDHAYLLRLIDSINADCESINFTARVRRAVQAAAEVGSLPIMSFQVFIHCQHFIGPHQLILTQKSLEDGLRAYDMFRQAKGPTLYKGAGVTEAYTPEAARQQWKRVRELYINWASCRAPRAQVEARMRRLEAAHTQQRLRKDAKIRQFLDKPNYTKRCRISSDFTLARQVARLLRRYDAPASRSQACRSAAKTPKKRVSSVVEWERVCKRARGLIASEGCPAASL